MDGHTATKLIIEYERSRNVPHTHIIALTAHAYEYEIVDVMQSGVDDLVTKPIKKDILMEKLDRIFVKLYKKSIASLAGKSDSQ
jgi:CheY-like chemotaxis protein